MAGDLCGRRDSPAKPSRPDCRYRSTHLRSVGRELYLFKQLNPTKPLPNVAVHLGQGNWKRCLLTTPLIARWIPAVRILHPFPNVRFAAKHPR
jgi:hypothetical protein